jgi:rhodanese-related sulfurtransferase
VASLTINELLASSRDGIDRLTPEQAAAEHAAGALLVDTRCPDARRVEGDIPGAVRIPLSVLYWRLDPASESADRRFADRSRRIILLCAHGYSSSLAARTLRDLGFPQATDVIGGFEAWLAAGLAVSPGASPS